MLLVRAEATSSKSPAFTSSPPSSVVIPSAQADGLMTIGDAGLRATLPSQEAALQRTACPRTASMPSRGLPAGGPTTTCTGTHRQAEVIRLLLDVQAGLRPDEPARWKSPAWMAAMGQTRSFE